MIAIVPIVDAKSDLKMTQNDLVNASVDWQSDPFKINNVSLYHILLKTFMDRDTYV